MAISVNLRKLLHSKIWEQRTPAPLSTATGGFVVSDKLNLTPKSPAIYVGGVSSIYRYEGTEDGWLQLPHPGIAGTFGAGACGELRGLGAMGGMFTQTATGGTTTTLITNRTIVMDLTGRKVRVVAGTGVGYKGTVDRNTLGANAVITVTPANGVAFDATTQYQVYSGSFWFFNPGTTAVGFSVYDFATNAWTARSVTGLPTAFGTDGTLVGTPAAAAEPFATGTSSGSNTSTTLADTSKAWAINMWANYQVRITAGTGKGQIRPIASCTGTVLTVASAWTVTPDATSQYAIESNDDSFYLFGNASVTAYRFTVSTNSWATLAPVAARAAAISAGGTANWIESVSTWTLPANGTPSSLLQSGALVKQNGRYIFSFRGGGSNALDIYDISGNTWVSNVAYGNQMETFTTGSSNCDIDGKIYLQKEATGRIFQFDISEFRLLPYSTTNATQSTTVVGNKMFALPYIDGADKITFIYSLQHYLNTLIRQMVI